MSGCYSWWRLYKKSIFLPLHLAVSLSFHILLWVQANAFLHPAQKWKGVWSSSVHCRKTERKMPNGALSGKRWDLKNVHRQTASSSFYFTPFFVSFWQCIIFAYVIHVQSHLNCFCVCCTSGKWNCMVSCVEWLDNGWRWCCESAVSVDPPPPPP